MKFTIVIPTYNGSAYVEEALRSAMNQTRKADAIIVSDDNSTDNTLEICSHYKDVVRIHKNENGPSGFVNGWNNAIRLVDDGFIAILHQDDLLAPTFLEEAEKALEVNPDVKHFFVPCNYIDGDGKVKRSPDYCDGCTHRYSGVEYADAYRVIGSPHIHRCPGVITHRSIFDVCQYRAEAGHIADDDFFYRVGQYTDVVGVLKPLASYREHEKSETGHLENIKLVSRLANDYLFQVKDSLERAFPHEELKTYFKEMARNFVTQYLILSLKLNYSVELKKAVENWKQMIQFGVTPSLKGRIVYMCLRVFRREITHKIITLVK